MKSKSRIVCSFIVLIACVVTALASDDHVHGKKQAGPNGGRVMLKNDPHVEFLVMADRKVQITFLGEDGKAIEPAGQIVTVTAGDRAAPTKLNFARAGGVLLSDMPLPAGNGFPAVVQIKRTPEAKAVVEKFTLDLRQCGECVHPEYACICDH